MRRRQESTAEVWVIPYLGRGAIERLIRFWSTSVRQSVHASLKLLFLCALGLLHIEAAPLLIDEADPEIRGQRIDGTNAWIEVDTKAFEENIQQMQEHLDGRAELCAIMKADAYGHGISGLLPIVIANNVTSIGITSNEEARMIRAGGFEGRLLRARSASRNEIEAGIQFKIEEIIGSLQQAEQIVNLSEQYLQPIPVHLVLNSSKMGRNGLELKTPEGKEEALAIVQHPKLKIVGMMTHYPRYDNDLIRTGAAQFEDDTNWLIDNSPLERKKLTLHTASTYAAMNVPESLFDMVRVGGALYGRNSAFKPLASFKTRVASLHSFPAGSKIGYGGTAILTRDSTLANLPVGYTDGIARSMSNRGYVLINGHRARIVGVTSMNTTMVDVTDFPDIELNDIVVLYGEQGDDQIDIRANRSQSNRTYSEQAAVWGATNPRVYY